MVICGKGGEEFKTKKKYLEHECVETGYTPKDPEHFGSQFLNVQKAALKRGKEKNA